MRPYWMLSMVLLAACASTPKAEVDEASRSGAVGMREINEAAPDARIELAANESFLPPLEDDANTAPVYPEALLARQLPPRTVCLRVGITAGGAVQSATPLVQPPDCPQAPAAEPEFAAAAQQAVQRWRFDPALRCIFPDAKTKDSANGSCEGGRGELQPVSLAYRFVFEQKDGRGSVRMSQ